MRYQVESKAARRQYWRDAVSKSALYISIFWHGSEGVVNNRLHISWTKVRLHIYRSLSRRDYPRDAATHISFMTIRSSSSSRASFLQYNCEELTNPRIPRFMRRVCQCQILEFSSLQRHTPILHHNVARKLNTMKIPTKNYLQGEKVECI